MADTSTSYKCPNCGAPLNYRPGMGEKIKCEYCESEITVAALEELFEAKNEAASKAQEANESKWNTKEAGNDWDPEEAAIMKAMTCSSCGAEIVCDENTMATECCYCGNPTMLPNRFDDRKGLKPEYVIPFTKDKNAAKAAFKAFHDGKWLLPDNFATTNRMEAIQGMYVPFWLFDSKVEANAVFSGEKVRHYTSGDYDVKETEHYKCYRYGAMDFHKIPADGSSKMDDTWMESIEPFNYNEMKAFNTSYLAGYLADKYDVEAESLSGRIDKRMENTATDELEKTVTGYSSVSVDNCSINKLDASVNYCMAPVWILSNKYDGKVYSFMMNGQTGKLVGSLPIDGGKVTKYFLLSTVLSSPITYYISKMMNLLDEPVNASFAISWVVMAAVLSLLFGWAFVSYLKGRMSNVAPVNAAREYLDSNSVKIKKAKDVYSHTTVTKVKREKK